MEDIGSNPMPDITSDGPEGQRIEVITVDVEFDRFFNGAPAPLPPMPPPTPVPPLIALSNEFGALYIY